MSNHFFVVACHGLSASNWVASALNSHPEILCTHGAGKFLFDQNNKSYSLEMEEQATKKFQEGVEDIETHFRSLITIDDAKAFGSVHYYRLRNFFNIDDSQINSLGFTIANLIRHPVNLVNSGFNLNLDQLAKNNPIINIEIFQFATNAIDFYQSHSQKHKINLIDVEYLSFLAAAQHLNILAQESAKFPSCRHILMERAVSDLDYWEDIVKYLTGGQINIDEAYLNRIAELGRINAHAPKKVKTPEETFNSWADWQKEGFLHFFRASEIQKVYEPYGYDFSFLEI